MGKSEDSGSVSRVEMKRVMGAELEVERSGRGYVRPGGGQVERTSVKSEIDK